MRLTFLVVLVLSLGGRVNRLAAQVPDYVPSEDLVGWWSFSGTPEDVSTQQMGGVAINAVPTTDRFGDSNSAYSFNGYNAYIEVPHHPDLNSLPFTVSVWFKPDSADDQGHQPLVTKYLNASWNGWNLGLSGPSESTETMDGSYILNSPYVWGQNPCNCGCQGIIEGYGDCGSGIRYTGELFDGHWHLSTFVVDSVGGKLFLDGAEVTSQVWAGLPESVANGFSMLIGAYRMGSGPWTHYQGKLDDVGVWKRALNAEEVAELFVNGSCAPFSRVFNDFNHTCTDLGVPVSNVVIEINPGGFVAVSDNMGDVFTCNLGLPDGAYTATLQADAIGWQQSCVNSFDFMVLDGVVGEIPHFGIYNDVTCPDPDVSIVAPTIRRCSEHTWPIFVQVCNSPTATGIFEDGYVIVDFEEGVIVEGADAPFIELGANSYAFTVGDILPGECIDVIVDANFSCDLELGETLCMEAALHPVPECALDSISGVPACETPWDFSNLTVQGACEEGTNGVTFVVTNTGQSMVCESAVRAYRNALPYANYVIQLEAGEESVFAFPPDGATWYLEATQHPLHPGNSLPNDHVEGCGNVEGEGDGVDDDGDGDSEDDDEWQPGLVDDVYCGDESPFVDLFCGSVVGSFDPNDKQVFPGGVGEVGAILPDIQLQYLIRFQNTGTAPAYTVVVRDTLDIDLDILSVTSGTSSHDYSFTMFGNRVLEWTFSNIMLPDSFSNEEESHGFISFSVNLNQGLADGVEITNNAAIYFDSNEPVITNTTLNTIDQCLLNHSYAALEAVTCDEYVAPDGQVYTASGTYTAILDNAMGCDSVITIYLELSQFEAQILDLGDGMLLAQPEGLNYQWIDCNSSMPIAGANSSTFFNIDGVYSVIVDNGVCSSETDCVELVNVGALRKDDISVYPVPADNVLNVRWNGAAGPYQLLGIDGRVFAEGLLSQGLNLIDVSRLSQGNYFIQVNSSVFRISIQ